MTIECASNNRVGEIISITTTNIPSEYLLCNGMSVNILQYPELFQVIGYTYGGKNNYFYLPDIPDEYIYDTQGSWNIKHVIRYTDTNFWLDNGL